MYILIILLILLILFAGTIVAFWPYILFFGVVFYLVRYVRDNPDEVKRGFRKVKNMISNVGSDPSCGVCNRDIGMMSGHTVKDGRVCKRCAEYLSPNFKAYDESTIADIEKQLSERIEFIDTFTPQTYLGGMEGIYYDMESEVIGIHHQQPIDSPYNVEFFRKDQVKNAQLDIVRSASRQEAPTQMDMQEAQEHLDAGYGSDAQRERWRAIANSGNPYGIRNGRMVLKMEAGEKPPTITKRGYDFYLVVHVDNDYAGTIRYKLNEDPIYDERYSSDYEDMEHIGNKIVRQLLGQEELPQVP